MSRMLTLLYALDSFVRTLITLGRCEIGDTLSSKAFQLEQKGRTHGKVFRRLIDWLFVLTEKDHCHQAHLTYRRIRNVL